MWKTLTPESLGNLNMKAIWFFLFVCFFAENCFKKQNLKHAFPLNLSFIYMSSY